MQDVAELLLVTRMFSALVVMVGVMTVSLISEWNFSCTYLINALFVRMMSDPQTSAVCPDTPLQSVK